MADTPDKEVAQLAATNPSHKSTEESPTTALKGGLQKRFSELDTTASPKETSHKGKAQKYSLFVEVTAPKRLKTPPSTRAA